MLKIQVKARAGKKLRGLPLEVELPSASSKGSALVNSVSKATKLDVHRLRLTTEEGNNALDPDKSLQDNSITKSGSVVIVKDLGPQIGWRTVFLIEYLGPLLIHPLLFWKDNLIYGKHFEHSDAQNAVYTMVMAHFLKREYETLFVHKFSLATMPLRNVFKNSFHYWVLSGLLLGYVSYSPNQALGNAIPAWQVQVARVVFTFAEASNYMTHKNLASLRHGPNDKEHRIPYGYGFDWVSCPNYFFESVAWVAIALAARNWAAFLFVAVSTGQMWVWAVKKHRRYKKEFGAKYPSNRKVMFPYIA